MVVRLSAYNQVLATSFSGKQGPRDSGPSSQASPVTTRCLPIRAVQRPRPQRPQISHLSHPSFFSLQHHLSLQQLQLAIQLDPDIPGPFPASRPVSALRSTSHDPDCGLRFRRVPPPRPTILSGASPSFLAFFRTTALLCPRDAILSPRPAQQPPDDEPSPQPRIPTASSFDSSLFDRAIGRLRARLLP